MNECDDKGISFLIWHNNLSVITVVGVQNAVDQTREGGDKTGYIIMYFVIWGEGGGYFIKFVYLTLGSQESMLVRVPDL